MIDRCVCCGEIVPEGTMVCINCLSNNNNKKKGGLENMVKFYTIGCPACNVLKKKLDSKKIDYELIDNKEVLISKNFNQLPMLEVDDIILNYKEAIDWINNK